MYRCLLLTLVTLSLPQILPVNAQTRPPPGAVSVGSVAVDNSSGGGGARGGGGGGQGVNGGGEPGGTAEPGTACRQNSVGTTLARDNSFMTLIFDDLSAQIGPSVPAAKQRGYCTVTVKLITPAGWSYAVDTADYRGYCRLDQGVNGTVTATYDFTGQTGKANIEKVVKGPMSTDFLVHQLGETGGQVWSPCGKNATLKMTVNVKLASTNKAGTGIMVTDSADARFNQTLNLGWKQC